MINLFEIIMEPKHSFLFCPRCGVKYPSAQNHIYFHCNSCGYSLFFNTATAVACFVSRSNGQVLFIRRAKEPSKGKLAPPGGFVDFKETAEEALRREIQEEVNMRISDIEYLCTFPNRYHYMGLTYQTLDIFYKARSTSGKASAMDEVASIIWLKPGQVKAPQLAFPSVRKAWKCWLNSLKKS